MAFRGNSPRARKRFHVNRRTAVILIASIVVAALAAWTIFMQFPSAFPGQRTTESAAFEETAGPTPTQYATPVQYPFAKSDVVQLAWFTKPPKEELFPVLAREFDLFILTHKDEVERDKIAALGVDQPFLQYLSLLEIHDPGNCTDTPYGNQVAYRPGDFCRITQDHPDWMLRDLLGNPFYGGDDSVTMNPADPGYQEFWVQSATEMKSFFGWDGVFIDNVEGSLRKIIQHGTLPTDFKSDREYQTAIESLLYHIRTHYSGVLIGNIVSTDDTAVFVRYARHLDGFMMEKFAVDWSNGYLDEAEWEAQLKLVEWALSSHKTVILVAQGDENNSKRQEFAFASYLLVSDGHAAFRYANSDNYREVWLYPNYEIDLGLPLGQRYLEKGDWRRDFEKGYVIVDPSTHHAEIMSTP